MKKILKYVLFLVFFLNTFFLFNNIYAGENFVPFKTPHIKDDYCGSKLMGYKYCKCAFHDQYCDSIGMTSSSANNFVQSSYSEYINNLKIEVSNKCNQDINSFWSNAKSGCTTCSDPDFNVDKTCENIEELCSNDELVTWDMEKKSCVCPKYYKWNEDELFCEEMPDVIFNTEFLDNIPLQADGINSVKIKITMQDIETEEYKKLEFDLKNSTVGISGKIELEGDENEYIIQYTTPDITKKETNQGSDFLYVFYYNIEGEKQYKTLEIPLVTGDIITVGKTGFVLKEGIAIFTSETSKVKVVTLINGDKIPVVGATLNLKASDIYSGITNEEGVAELSSPRSIDGEEITETEIVIEIDNDVKKYQKKALKNYNDVVNSPIKISNETINDFITRIDKYLAKASDDDEAKKYISGLRRIAYSLFFIESGSKLADESSKEIGKAINGQISAIIDLIDPIGKITGKLEEKIGIKFESSSKLKEIQNKLKSFTGKYISKLTGMLGNAIKSFAPSLDSELVTGMLNDVLGVDNYKEDLIKKPLDTKLKNITNIESKITNYFMDEYKKETNKMMSSIANQIKSNSFEAGITDEQLEAAKNSYIKITEQYLRTHDIDYNTTMTKAYTQLGFDVIGKGISYTTAYGKLVEGAEKVYEIAKVAYFDNKIIYTWFETYGSVMKNITTSVNKSIGIAMGKPDSYVNNIDFVIFPKALANEVTDDINSIVKYFSISGGIDIYGDLKEIGLLLLELDPENIELQEIVNGIDLKIKGANEQINTLPPGIDKKVEKIKGCYSDSDENCDGKVDLSDFTKTELITLLTIILFFLGIILLIIKKRKNKV